jgi:outer membrane protein assembly factor BamB
MGKVWVLLSTSLIFLFLALIGCRGGLSAPHPDANGNGNPAAGGGGTDTGSGVAWWDEDKSDLFPVRMNPQPVAQTGGWPAQHQASGVATQPELPEPSELANLLPQTKQAAYDDADLVKAGADFDALLPSSRVSTVSAPSAIFSPIWGEQAQPVLEDAAYCIYRFDLSGFAHSGQPQTFALAWFADSEPTDYANLWVGFANRTANRWDWYAGPQDDVLTLDSYAPYIAGNGNALIAIVMLGSDECALNSIKIGEPELRATGVMPDAWGVDHVPPPNPSTLPSSFDLSADCSPVGDQLQVGACMIFSTARGAFDYELGRTYQADGWDFSDPYNLSSTKYLYYMTGLDQGLGCPKDGRYPDDTFEYLAQDGDSSELNAPYLNVCTQDWGAEAVIDADFLNMERVHNINPIGQSGILKVKSILATQRKILVFVVKIDWSFFGLGPDTVWNNNGTSIVGYHGLCIVGYDDSKQAFKVRNSWGADWAGGGYCWIGYKTFLMGYKNFMLHAWSVDVDYDPAVGQKYCGQHQVLCPPAALQASNGIYPDRIELTWQPSASATEYRVYRDQRESPLTSVADATTWSDYTIADNYSHVYWVQAIAPGRESTFNSPEVGYLAQAPVILSVTPQTGASGARVLFRTQISGSAPLTCIWDFGGGATPNTSEGDMPDVTLGDAGSYNASLTVTNDYGSDNFRFLLYVGKPDPRPGDWWMCGRNPLHNARSPFTGPATNALKWSYSVGSAVYSSPAITADGTVYVGTETGSIFAVNPDGSPKWIRSTLGPVYSSPAIGADGTVYVGCWDKWLCAFTPDGNRKWTAGVGPPGFASPAISTDGTAYIGSVVGCLYAINPDSSQKWHASAGAITCSSAAIGADGTVYVGSWDSKLHAINPDGSLKWEYATGDKVLSSPAIGADGTVYVGSKDNNFYAVNPDGSLKWSYTTGGSVCFSPAIGADETVYVGSLDGMFYAINPDGSLKWSYAVPSAWESEYSSPAIDADGTVYVGSDDTNLYALNPDGTLKWIFTTGGSVHSSPAIGADGTVYVGSNDGKLYAIGPGDG